MFIYGVQKGTFQKKILVTTCGLEVKLSMSLSFSDKFGQIRSNIMELYQQSWIIQCKRYKLKLKKNSHIFELKQDLRGTNYYSCGGRMF